MLTMYKHYTDGWDHYLNSVATNSRIEERQKRRLLKSTQILKKSGGKLASRVKRYLPRNPLVT